MGCIETAHSVPNEWYRNSTKLLDHATLHLLGNKTMARGNCFFLNDKNNTTIQMTEWNNNSYFDYNVGTQLAV